MNPRGKPFAISSAVMAVVVLAVASWTARSSLVEEWYMWRLKWGNDDDYVVAAEKLAEMRSLRAIPSLLKAVSISELQSRDVESWKRVLHSTAALGRFATLELLKAWQTEDFGSSGLVFGVIYPETLVEERLGSMTAHSLDPKRLLNLLQDDSSQPAEVRRLAAQYLKNPRYQ